MALEGMTELQEVVPLKEEPKIEGDETPEELEEELETIGAEEPDADALETVASELEEEEGLPYRPTLAEVNKEFPELFKKFPDLRSMYFREAKYVEIFPTVEDAKVAKEELDGLTSLQEHLQSGTTEGATAVLGAIKELGENNLSNFAINFLPTLKKSDPEAYYSAIAPETVAWVRNLYQAGARLGPEAGKNLMNAAKVASLFYFEDMEVATGQKNVKLPEIKTETSDKKDDGVNKERAAFLKERHDALFIDIGEDYSSQLGAFIAEGLDSDGVITPRVKEWIVRDVIARIDKVLASDRGHRSQMEAMWKKAASDKYGRNWKDRILSAALSRAKTIVPTIRARAKAEALSTKIKQGSKVLQKGKEERKEVQNVGTGRSNQSLSMSQIGKLDSKKIDWKKTSDLDILNTKVILKS